MTGSDDRPSGGRNDQTPAKTDEPFTEMLFGADGVRAIHFAVYTVVFVVVAALFDLIFATLRTGMQVLINIFDLTETVLASHDPIAEADATLTMLFGQNMLHPGVIGAALLVAFLLTSLVYYWNEIRYRRGEWLRTFL